MIQTRPLYASASKSDVRETLIGLGADWPEECVLAAAQYGGKGFSGSFRVGDKDFYPDMLYSFVPDANMEDTVLWAYHNVIYTHWPSYVAHLPIDRYERLSEDEAVFYIPNLFIDLGAVGELPLWMRKEDLQLFLYDVYAESSEEVLISLDATFVDFCRILDASTEATRR